MIWIQFFYLYGLCIIEDLVHFRYADKIRTTLRSKYRFNFKDDLIFQAIRTRNHLTIIVIVAAKIIRKTINRSLCNCRKRKEKGKNSIKSFHEVGQFLP